MLADRIKSTAAQVVVSWAVPLLGQVVNALTASTTSVMLQVLLERLGKSDKRREERGQSNQELYEL